jgi:hypothetical protein
MDKATILLFVLAGSVAIIVLKLEAASLFVRVVVPCSILLSYAAFTVLRTRFRLRYDQVGDNCYYLGFIFTLLSLGVALYLIQSNVTAGRYVAEIIRDFGVALSTTLLGIVLRVFLNQLREDPSDIEEAVQNELFEQSQKLSGQMRAAVVALDEMANETADKMKNYVFAMRQVVGEHEQRVVELRDATAKLVTSVEKLASDLGSAEIPTGRLREASAGTVAALEGARKAISAIEVGSLALVAQFDQSSRSVKGASDQANALAKSTEMATGAANAASEALTALGEAGRLATSRVRSAADEMERTEGTMSATARSAANVASDHAAVMARAAESMRSSAAAMEAAAAAAADLANVKLQEASTSSQVASDTEPTRGA